MVDPPLDGAHEGVGQGVPAHRSHVLGRLQQRRFVAVRLMTGIRGCVVSAASRSGLESQRVEAISAATLDAGIPL